MRKLLLLLLLPAACLLQAQDASPVAAPSPATAARKVRMYNPCRNLFAEYLGKSEADLDAKLDKAWKAFFEGDKERQRLFYRTPEGDAYIYDTGNGDVRSEGMSYGMMLCVQLNKRAEFDALWSWAKKHMQHKEGPRKGYLAWQCSADGKIMDPVSACDGEEWIVMSLLFAAARWDISYQKEASDLLLPMMLRSLQKTSVASMFHPTQRQITFVPEGEGAQFTDPSYHLPGFYELWAIWYPGDKDFWKDVSARSRTLFKNAAHPQTGLMPDYSDFDGKPKIIWGGEHGDFRFDAWRTIANVALDHAWTKGNPWAVEQSNRVLDFLNSQRPMISNQYSLDGKRLSENSSTGLVAMAAVAGHVAAREKAEPFIRDLWYTGMPEGKWRYYDGLLYMLGLLQVGGRFNLYLPPAPPKQN